MSVRFDDSLGEHHQKTPRMLWLGGVVPSSGFCPSGVKKQFGGTKHRKKRVRKLGAARGGINIGKRRLTAMSGGGIGGICRNGQGFQAKEGTAAAQSQRPETKNCDGWTQPLRPRNSDLARKKARKRRKNHIRLKNPNENHITCTISRAGGLALTGGERERDTKVGPFGPQTGRT